MAFCFTRKESVKKAVRRLGRKRIEAALKCLEDCHQTEAIHCARQEIKKARAVLRLTRARIAKEDYRRLNKHLREAADRLSVVRDAHVKGAALEDLATHFKSQLTPRALRHVREALQTDLREEANRFAKGQVDRVVGRILRRAGKDFEELTVAGKGWQALSPGVKTAYTQGREALRAVLKEPSPENLHEWRKRVKILWYHLRLLQPISPNAIQASSHELEMLGEQLGDDHDLFLLQQAADKHGRQHGHRKELETLRRLIEQRQRELRLEALKVGMRFYAQKPSVFSKQLSSHWRLWRHKRQVR